jgi:hypothetical protein
VELNTIGIKNKNLDQTVNDENVESDEDSEVDDAFKNDTRFGSFIVKARENFICLLKNVN